MRTTNLLKVELSTLCTLLLAGPVLSQLPATLPPYVGVNFQGRPAPGTALDSGDVAGYIPQGHWNNIHEQLYPDFSGTSGALLDSAGNATPVTLTFQANDSWNNDGPAGTPDEKLMHGVIKAFGNF